MSQVPAVAVAVVRSALRAEDVFPRSIHHFYDPKNERSLTLLPWSRKSPDWALEDLGDIASYPGRSAFYNLR